PGRAPHGFRGAAVRSGDRHGRGPPAGSGQLRRRRRRPKGSGSLYGAPGGVTALLRVEGLVGGYGAADEVLKGIGIALPAHRMAAVVGPNGAGKSTLLKAIAGLIRPKAGRIALDGQPLAGMPPRAVAMAGIAFVPQEANVFPSLSVAENLEIGGWI